MSRPLQLGTLLFVFAALSATRSALSAPTADARLAHDPKLEARVDAYLRPYVDLDIFQGAILIARGGRVVLRKAYGFANVELGVRATPEHVFRIASITKPFTEVLLGRLVEQGKLDLDAPLSRYLSGFPKGDSITIEMLRTHRAGIPNENSIPYDEEAHGPNTLDSLVRRIAHEPLVFPPGSRTRYSNGNYAVLGAVIEKVTGQSYADALEERVLLPLKLTHTRHEADGEVIASRAYGYVVSYDERDRLLVAPYQEMVTKTGGGSLVSTVDDLQRFLRVMYADNAVRAETWRTLFPPDSLFTFQGRCPGFNVWMGRDFTGDVEVVVLCNNYAGGMVGTIGSDFLALARGREISNPHWRADLAVDSVRAEAFLGTYRAAPGALPYGDGPYSVRRHGGQLVIYRGNVSMDVLIPQGDDAFLLRNAWSEMRFTAAGPGERPAATLRPLWFRTDAIPLTRVP